MRFSIALVLKIIILDRFKVIANSLWNLQVGENSYEIVRLYTTNFEKVWVEVVEEEHIKQGIWMLYEEERIEVEGEGAITLAACLYNLQHQLQGKK